MLSNKAVNLMLNTYKGLSDLKVLDSGNTFLGGSSVAWQSAVNSTIKTLPVTVLAEKKPTALPIRYFNISGTVPVASTRQDVLGSAPNTSLNYYSRLSQAYQQSLPNNNSIVDGIKYGSKVYNFKLFKADISAPLPNISNENLTGTYTGAGPAINETLYEFVDSKVNTDQPTFHTVRVTMSSGGAHFYYFLIAIRDEYETSGSSTKLVYDLSDFGYNDTIEVDTLIKVPSGISGGLAKL